MKASCAELVSIITIKILVVVIIFRYVRPYTLRATGVEVLGFSHIGEAHDDLSF